VPQESVVEAADALRAFLADGDPAAVSARSRARYAARFAPAPFADRLATVLRDQVGARPAQRSRQLPSR
jgi:hypothetical protein